MEGIYNRMKLITIVAILLLTSEVFCIKCFQCNSNNNSACVNLEMLGKNPLYPTECDGDYGGEEPFCRKIIIKLLEANKDHEPRVIRSCGWVRYKNPCYNADNDDHTERVCQCFEDGCNGGGHLKTFSFLSTLFISLITTYLCR